MTQPDRHRHLRRFHGKFRGVVVGADDDTFSGSVRVTVPDVFGAAEVSAEPCLPYGHFFVPPPGTHVWVEFEAGDPERAIWVGVWYPKGTTPQAARVDPPQRRVIVTAAGHTVELDDTEGGERILIRHAADAFVSISPDGDVLVANAKGSHLNLDAKNGAVTLVEQHGNHLVLGEKGATLVNPDGTMVNLTGGTVHVSASSVILEGTTVALGARAAEPTVMGTAFSALWNLVLTHTHATATGGPAAPSVELQAARLIPGTHLSSSVVVK